MQQSPDFTPKSFLFLNRVIFSAIFMGTLIATIVLQALSTRHYFSLDFNENMFMLLVPIVTVTALSVGNGIFKVYLKQAREKNTLKAKLLQYRVALITRLALTEAPAIFGAIAFSQEGNHFYLLFTLISIVIMLTYYPSSDKVIKNLELRGDDLDAYNNKESKVH